MIDVKCDVKTYEKENTDNEVEKVLVESHWNNDRMVHLNVGIYKITVGAKDLITAIENCTRTSKF